MIISAATRRRRTATAIAVVVAGGILLGAGPAARTLPAAVDLRTATSFAILAGGGVTDTGPSVITGDVGTHPVPAIPDLVDKETSGVVDRAGSQAGQAERDLAVAFATAAKAVPDAIVDTTHGQTLTPGAYTLADAKQNLAGTLILDGGGHPGAVWVFLATKDLVTAPASSVELVNGAQACNVFWRVDGSATLAAGSTFAGSILATTSVTVGHDVTIAGRLLAMTGRVSLGGDKVAVPRCALPAAVPAALAAAPVALAAQAGTTPGAAGPLSAELRGLLPIVMLVLLVAAVILGEPRHRYRRTPRRRW